MFYLRKVTRGRWSKENSLPQTTLEDIPADTVVSEFRTDKNKLSVWKIETDDDLSDAFIALASNCDNIGTIDAVKIDEKDLADISFDEEDGNTPTIGINHKHRNIIDLNYVNLGTVIQSMIYGFQKDQYIHLTKGKLKQLLADAYEQNRLNTEELAPSVLRDIEKTVAARWGA